MKTPYVHLDQSLLDSTKLMITGAKAFKWNRLFALSGITADRVNYYLTLVVKQIFSDNFSGSDAEVGMVLIFLKGYFLSAADLLRNNVITDLFRKLKAGQSNVVVLDAEKNYSYNKAA
ncbi:MAG TPA: hypothetical protein VK671_03740, partial [Mucilaginibacter sp.]|jgi:hypothetical protein|nr:hypothetical protein [Mucilaginibacter sp.]